MSSEGVGTPTQDVEELAERYRASTGWEMAEGHAIADAFIAGHQAGTPTHGGLDREKAEEAVEAYNAKFDAVERASLYPGEPGEWMRDLLDALEACVVPDPRITRIEVVLDLLDGHDEAGNVTDYGTVNTHALRAILRGDQ